MPLDSVWVSLLHETPILSPQPSLHSLHPLWVDGLGDHKILIRVLLFLQGSKSSGVPIG